MAKEKQNAEPPYIRSLSIENIGCFGSRQDLYFTKNNQADGEPALWNIIIGENGTGKTTVLSSLAGSVAKLLVKKDKHNDSHIQIKVGNYDLFLVFDINNKAIFGENSTLLNQHIPIIVYSASRIISQDTHLVEIPFSPDKFDQNEKLLNAEAWLIQAEHLALREGGKYEKRFEIVKDVLRKLLKQEISDFEIRTEDDTAKVYFKTHYGWVRLHDLSLGYKTLLGWVTSLAKNLIGYFDKSDSPLSEPIICLVDEIDLHMHPQMQRRLMGFLRETFPKTQFICTAHSPLILQSMHDANVVLLRREGDEVRAINDVDYIKNWRIDQIFESDLFGISSYAPEIEAKMEERRAILLKDEPNTKDKKRLTELEVVLDNLSVRESPEYLEGRKLLDKLQKNDSLK